MTTAIIFNISSIWFDYVLVLLNKIVDIAVWVYEVPIGFDFS